MTAATDPATAGPGPSSSTGEGVGTHPEAGSPAVDGGASDEPTGGGPGTGERDSSAGDPAEVAAERIREASLELIAAARKLLDAAEEALEDPQRVARTIRAGTGLVEDLLERLGRFGNHARAAGRDAPDEPGPQRVTQIPLD